MKLTIVGCNGPFPSPGGACSCYLVQTDKTNLILDMGGGSLGKLSQYINLRDIDAIVLSHLHFDHMGDVPLLGYAYSMFHSRENFTQMPKLFMPRTPEDIASLMPDKLDITYIDDYLSAKVGDITLTFHRADHAIETYGIIVEWDGKRLAYTGDTTNGMGDATSLAKDATLFLADGGLLEKHKGGSHMTVKEACEAGKTSCRTVITHISPSYTQDELMKEICEGAELATNGATYQL